MRKPNLQAQPLQNSAGGAVYTTTHLSVHGQRCQKPNHQAHSYGWHNILPKASARAPDFSVLPMTISTVATRTFPIWLWGCSRPSGDHHGLSSPGQFTRLDFKVFAEESKRETCCGT